MTYTDLIAISEVLATYAISPSLSLSAERRRRGDGIADTSSYPSRILALFRGRIEDRILRTPLADRHRVDAVRELLLACALGDLFVAEALTRRRWLTSAAT